jgi:hypothetical protein
MAMTEIRPAANADAARGLPATMILSGFGYERRALGGTARAM